MCPEIHYVVNPERREVIAYTDNTCHHAVLSVLRRLPYRSRYCYVLRNGNMPNKFRVVVKCHPEDEFDAEIGKKIAKKRLLDNYWKSRHKAEHRIKQELEAEVASINEVISKLR